MARSQRQGWALLLAISVLFLAGVTALYVAESGSNAALRGLTVDQAAGNLEGKETRFGVAASALFATVTTDASCGAVNSMHDSFTPLGGLVPMVNIQLGELVFGGVGSGLYAMLVYDSEEGGVAGASILLQDVTRLMRFDELKNNLVATVARVPHAAHLAADGDPRLPRGAGRPAHRAARGDAAGGAQRLRAAADDRR